jgi:hypothetical protein
MGFVKKMAIAKVYSKGRQSLLREARKMPRDKVELRPAGREKILMLLLKKD